MLTLKVKTDDYVLIGDDIMVRLIRDDKNNYKLAIDAPDDYNIIKGDSENHKNAI